MKPWQRGLFENFVLFKECKKIGVLAVIVCLVSVKILKNVLIKQLRLKEFISKAPKREEDGVIKLNETLIESVRKSCSATANAVW